MNPIKRRSFLQTAAGAAGLGALLPALGAPKALAANPAAPAANKEAVANLMAEMEKKGRQMLSVPREDGQFLNLMVKAARAKHVLEVGTSHGYSALWISLGLEETGGKLTTVEILPERVRLAKSNLEKAGLARRVEFKEGNAHQIVPELEGPFDFVFLDADKDRKVDYFNYLYPNKLAPGGLLLVHNAIHFRQTMRAYLDLVAAHPEFDSVMLSLTMDDGFSVSYRHRS
jgi:caffeoyl-CoA O-methyltransferase